MLQPAELMQRHGLRIQGVIHVGANTGQERELYRSAGAKRVLWIEPIPDVYRQLRENIESYSGHTAVQAVCTASEGDLIKFNVATNSGESSSIFGLGKHETIYPTIKYMEQLELRSTTLDGIMASNNSRTEYNTLVIDTQGAELLVLMGSVETLKDIEGLYIEVSNEPMYDGGCTLLQLTDFLNGQNFAMKWLDILQVGWGNAFFVNQRIYGPKELPSLGDNLALHKPTRQSSVYPWDSHIDPVDGIVSGGFGFHTELEANPWWEVDLGEPTPLRELRVFNRGDDCQERSRTLVALLSVDGVEYKKVHDQGGVPFGLRRGDRLLRIPLSNEIARFVRLQLQAHEYFHLDEVEIY